MAASSSSALRVFLLSVLVSSTAIEALAQGTEKATPNPWADVPWKQGASVIDLGDLATLSVPEGFMWLEPDAAKRFLEMTENIPSGNELAIVSPMAEDKTWWATFTFSEIGYVKDDERDKLDAAKILASLREGTEESNKERKRRNWPAMHVVGWRIAPAYNVTTNNLEWAIDGTTEGEEGVSTNHATRILGRNGVMRIGLVCSPEELDGAVADLRSMLGGFSFRPGKRYFEFREGDKIAAVGLTGLIVGGAAVAAAKSGLLVKLFKPLLLAALALLAGLVRGIKGFFGRITGRTE